MKDGGRAGDICGENSWYEKQLATGNKIIKRAVGSIIVALVQTRNITEMPGFHYLLN